MKGNKFLCILFILLICGFANAQKSKSQLEKEKKRNLKKLQQTSKILKETKTKKIASIGQLNAINQQEIIQTSLIKNISSELTIINSEIRENEWLLTSLSEDSKTLKEDYANMVYQSSKATNSYNKLMFVFTSESFYEMVMRINYLDQYTKARKIQVNQILKVSEVLNEQRKTLTNQHQVKNGLLSTQVIERENLLVLKDDKEKVISTLSQDEKKLKKDLAKQKKQLAQLEKMISDIVRKEMAKINKGDKYNLKLTPEAALLSKNFIENKGRLIWPVAYGFIYQSFGEQWHPTIKGVKIINIGIDIQTKKGAEVRAVFDGDVIAVANVPGMNKMIMIQHGEFFTVYTKVTNVFVKAGDKIKRKEPLGMTVTNSENVTTMQFQVWKNTTKLNPELWLVKQ